MQLYLKNLFSNTERHALEKEVMQDPFEAEAFDGLSELSAEAFETDIKKLQSQLNKRSKKRKGLFWQRPYAIAASVLFLISLGLTMFVFNKDKEAYQIVTNTQDVEDAMVVNESTVEKESNDKALFQEPDFNSIEETIVAYETIEEDVPVVKKAETAVKKPVFSKKASSAPPAKTISADVEVFNEVEAESDTSAKPILNEPDSYRVERLRMAKGDQETKIATSESSEIETWSGTITDNYGMPLAGVNVIVKDSEEGVVTDFEGNYTIKVPKDAEIEANHIGFENTKIAYKSHKSVIMDEDQALLDEVVVIGYGARKKRNITGSVEKMKGENLFKESSVQVEEALKGRVAGVKVSSTEMNSDMQIHKSAIAPQGSDDAFKQWVMTQLNPSEFEKGKEYSIDIRFVIDEKGKVSALEIPTNLKVLEKEHLKAIFESSSPWIPAQKNNRTIKESKALVLWFHF